LGVHRWFAAAKRVSLVVEKVSRTQTITGDVSVNLCV
jgi:hypothetical protein